MAKEPTKIYTCGLIEVVPSGGKVGYSSKNSCKRGLNESNEVENTTRTIYKDNYSGCSSRFTKKHKAEEFVDKHTGQLGYKEEVKYTSSLKVNDKVQGNSTEYQTQVKFKKVTTTYPKKGATKSNNKHIDYY